MVVRNGRIAHLEAHGLIDIESNRPMPKDGIFRLASMSKPITAVAVMMMLEEGKLRLNDPVSRFIPEFKSMKVAVPKPGSEAAAAAPGGRGGRGGPPVEVDLVPASREITVRDLLTHGSGLMSGGLGQRASASLAQRAPDDTLATYIPKLGGAALDFQPGTLWRYSGLAGFDVLEPHRRDHVGAAVRSLSEAASVRSARHEGHRVRAPARSRVAHRAAVSPRRRTVSRSCPIRMA